MAAVNTQQAQELQKQQTILQQLNQEFEQQQSILQGEIQRLAVLQQQKQQSKQTSGDQNVKPPSQAAAASTSGTFTNKNINATASKRSSQDVAVNGDSGAQRLNKIAKTSGTGETSNTPAQKSNESGGQGAANLVGKKSSSDIGVSLIKNMPSPAIEQHVESLESSAQLSPQNIIQKCLPLVKKLINHDDGWVFKDAVDPLDLGIPDYFDVVDNPMDLTLVTNKLEGGTYKDFASFEKTQSWCSKMPFFSMGRTAMLEQWRKDCLGFSMRI